VSHDPSEINHFENADLVLKKMNIKSKRRRENSKTIFLWFVITTFFLLSNQLKSFM